MRILGAMAGVETGLGERFDATQTRERAAG